MKSGFKCLECHLHGFLKLLPTSTLSDSEQEKASRAFLQHLATIDWAGSPPAIGRQLQPKIKELLHIDDPYFLDKKDFSGLVLNRKKDIKQLILQQDEPLLAAAKMAIAGNVLDSATAHQFDILDVLDQAMHRELAIDHRRELIENLKKANHSLYLCDNTGEIILDTLFIELLMEYDICSSDRLSAVVRGAPVLNDATREDAINAGLDQLVPILDNGDCAPGTELATVSPEFLKKFEQADLILSKGQGNFESLNTYPNKNIFFLLIAKCPLLADAGGFETGNFICQQSPQYTRS